jgi:hypothetical protein
MNQGKVSLKEIALQRHHHPRLYFARTLFFTERPKNPKAKWPRFSTLYTRVVSMRVNLMKIPRVIALSTQKQLLIHALIKSLRLKLSRKKRGTLLSKRGDLPKRSLMVSS